MSSNNSSPPPSEASVPGIVLVCDRKLRRVLY